MCLREIKAFGYFNPDFLNQCSYDTWRWSTRVRRLNSEQRASLNPFCFLSLPK
jgi:hypothetical protein